MMPSSHALQLAEQACSLRRQLLIDLVRSATVEPSETFRSLSLAARATQHYARASLYAVCIRGPRETRRSPCVLHTPVCRAALMQKVVFVR